MLDTFGMKRCRSTRSAKALAAFFVAAASLSVCAPEARAAGWPSEVTPLTVEAGKTASMRGNLSRGKPVDLAFAAKSSVACFPATENVNFSGNHVFYATQLPERSELKITVEPGNGTVDVSAYVLVLGKTDTSQVPPAVASAQCEAAYDAKKDGNPGVAETTKVVSTTNSYNVLIGVAGANGATSGAFTLKLDLVTASSGGSMTPLVATPIEAKESGIVTVDGKLDTGAAIDLGFASNSSVACWPATENANFQGHHVLYRTTIGKYTDMTITVTPKSAKTDVSLYAYEVGSSDTTTAPPTMQKCVTCEAGYDAKSDSNPGAAETVKLNAINNPYNVFIAVAGAKGVTSGEFTLQIETKSRK